MKGHAFVRSSAVILRIGNPSFYVHQRVVAEVSLFDKCLLLFCVIWSNPELMSGLVFVQLVVDVVLDDDNQAADNDGEWPFGPFVEQLIHDMFDPGLLPLVRMNPMLCILRLALIMAESLKVVTESILLNFSVPMPRNVLTVGS